MSLLPAIPEDPSEEFTCCHLVSLIRDYLMRFAVGRRNAKTCSEIEAYLDSERVRIRGLHELLLEGGLDEVLMAERLEDLVCICVIYKRGDRSFLILADAGDYRLMRRWRSARIAAYQRDLEHWSKLGAEEWGPL